MKESQVIEIMTKIREYGWYRVNNAFDSYNECYVSANKEYEAAIALLNEIREALRNA